jgi:hypothetical protein
VSWAEAPPPPTKYVARQRRRSDEPSEKSIFPPPPHDPANAEKGPDWALAGAAETMIAATAPKMNAQIRRYRSRNVMDSLPWVPREWRENGFADAE